MRGDIMGLTSSSTGSNALDRDIFEKAIRM